MVLRDLEAEILVIYLFLEIAAMKSNRRRSGVVSTILSQVPICSNWTKFRAFVRLLNISVNLDAKRATKITIANTAYCRSHLYGFRQIKFINFRNSLASV